LEKFILDGQYGNTLESYGINVKEVLRKAGVPEDIFSRKTPVMKAMDYFKFMEILGASIINPEIPIQIATAENIEAFSAPIFAAYCSKNGLTCIERLGRYKRLIGPMEYVTLKNNNKCCVEIRTSVENTEMPQFLVETEMVFLVNILRRATKETIYPLHVVMENPVKEAALEKFMAIQIEAGNKNQIIFSSADLQIPFVSFNDSIWNFFEPELKKRLSELEVESSIGARVRSVITELLPGGVSTIDEVAFKMGISKRTLQRKLSEENTSYQKQLNHTRELLAKHYILNTDMMSNDIAYLLGYQELNSFLRAFNIWTGLSISEFKRVRHD